MCISTTGLNCKIKHFTYTFFFLLALYCEHFFIWLKIFEDFAGGTVVKNPPANAGDTGLIPGPGRSHMLRNN